MKRYIHFLSLATLTVFLSACGNAPKHTDESNNNDSEYGETQVDDTNEGDKGEKGCVYTYVHDSTKVSFTAFKYESKAGVGGSFTACDVFALAETGSCQEVLTGMEFRIPISSSSTLNEDRDKKIAEHFWGTLDKADYITGEVLSTSGDESGGSAKMTLTLNGISKEIEGEYTLSEDGHIRLETSVDMTDFDGLEAIAALNKVCEDLHREAPGEESKLWPNVSVTVLGFLSKDCGE